MSGQGVHAQELDLSREQQRRVAAAIEALVAQHGSVEAVSRASGVSDGVIHRLRRARPWECRCMPASLDAVAKVAGVTREQLLSGSREGTAA